MNPNYDYTCGKGGTLAAIVADPADRREPRPGHRHGGQRATPTSPTSARVKDPTGRPRLLTSASSFGRLFTETDLLYDRRTSDIVRSSVKGSNLQVSRDVTPDPAQTSLIDLYKKLVTPIASKVIGHITTDVTAAQNDAGESALGDLIADAQLADPSVVTGGQTPVIAFMNPGGIRTDLTRGQLQVRRADR